MDEEFRKREMYKRFRRFMKDPPYQPVTNPWYMLVVSIALVLLFLLVIFSFAEASCSRNIDELTPQTRSVYHELSNRAKAEGIDFRIICSYRTQEEQNGLYAQGRTQPGKEVTWTRRSTHTQRIAFDIAVFKGGRISWAPEDYKRLGVLGKSLGLTWGGDWKVRDYGHFELKR